MSKLEMVQLLLEDFAKRASREEDRQYRIYRLSAQLADRISDIRWSGNMKAGAE